MFNPAFNRAHPCLGGAPLRDFKLLGTSRIILRDFMDSAFTIKLGISDALIFWVFHPCSTETGRPDSCGFHRQLLKSKPKVDLINEIEGLSF